MPPVRRPVSVVRSPYFRSIVHTCQCELYRVCVAALCPPAAPRCNSPSMTESATPTVYPATCTLAESLDGRELHPLESLRVCAERLFNVTPVHFAHLATELSVLIEDLREEVGRLRQAAMQVTLYLSTLKNECPVGWTLTVHDSEWVRFNAAPGDTAGVAYAWPVDSRKTPLDNVKDALRNLGDHVRKQAALTCSHCRREILKGRPTVVCSEPLTHWHPACYFAAERRFETR